MRTYMCAAMITGNVSLSYSYTDRSCACVSAMAATSATFNIACHLTALIMLVEGQTYNFTQFLVMFDIFVLLE
jgi:hypothetical protein